MSLETRPGTDSGTRPGTRLGTAAGTKKRVLIADDHPLLAEGIAALLAAEYQVQGVVNSGRQLMADAVRLQPEIIVLDISMPEMNGIEAAVLLRKMVPKAKLVFVTQRTDAQYLRAAFKAGAAAFVAKQSASSELLTALHHVTEGRRYVTPSLDRAGANEIEDGPINPLTLKLTERQREVLRLIAAGKTARSIGETLHISTKTVEFHKKSLMDSTGFRSTAELTKFAIAAGIVPL